MGRDSVITFLVMMVIRKGSILDTKVYRKPTHTGHYLHFQLNRPLHVMKGDVQSLYHRATIVCQEKQDRSDEADILTHDLQLSAYPI
jgi:hypothetical protein